jgi:acyl-CoA synthetase (NDP forming)
MEDCIAKGVKVAHFFTAGFSETGEPERAELEREVLAIAKRGGIRLIGPNCMGVYCPEAGLTFSEAFPREAGSVGMISQSGTNASEFTNRGMLRGLRFSKVVSFGNAADVNAAELFDYLAWDPKTELIAAYLEGVRDARPLFESLRRAAARKPVLILKGGRTEAGSRATASHTSSLAGNDILWDALCRQVGAIRVNSVEEMVDLAVTFRFLRPPQGPRVALLAGGGGISVLSTDEIASAGLQVPPLSDQTRQALRDMVPLAGHSIRNPLDASPLLESRHFAQAYEAIVSSDNIDLLMVMGGGFGPPGTDGDDRTQVILDTIRQKPIKPTAFIVRYGATSREGRAAHDMTDRLIEAGMPAYHSVAGAARAIDRYLRFLRMRNGVTATA